jgi:hypothetical protein
MDRTTYQTKTPKPEVSGEEYNKQAEAWLEATNSTLHVAYGRTGKYFEDDEEDRDIYRVTLKRGGAEYVFTFGQSIANSAPWMRVGSMCRTDYSYANHFADAPWKQNPMRSQPDAYTILSSLEGTNPGTFEDFCGEFGYDTDSRKAEKTYKAVVEQYLSLSRMYSQDELDKLADIR